MFINALTIPANNTEFISNNIGNTYGDCIFALSGRESEAIHDENEDTVSSS
jgi:hypothetical protein